MEFMPSINKPFQRIGSNSNSQVGQEFELNAKKFFESKGTILKSSYVVDVGIGQIRKKHSFDLGCSEQKWLVECKSHCWTSGHNVPSAKMTTWNEAMYYFHAAPPEYKKVMFVLKDLRRGTGESLCSYYLRTYEHLIPFGVEFWEFDESLGIAIQVRPPLIQTILELKSF